MAYSPREIHLETFKRLLQNILSCQICAAHLPFGVRPVLQAHPHARILIAGQAPGRRVHESGIPFHDPSGDRLREWMGIGPDIFYDARKVAIVPMGFCYPGTGKSGDLPPRPECALAWRRLLLSRLRHIELTLVMGRYALTYHLGRSARPLNEIVHSWREYWPALVPLPHSSPRNRAWVHRNPWFSEELLPALRQRVGAVLDR